MNIVLNNGDKMSLPWRAVVTGFVAIEATITESDAAAMLRQASDNPEEFRVYMLQFLNRFPVNRKSTT